MSTTVTPERFLFGLLGGSVGPSGCAADNVESPASATSIGVAGLVSPTGDGGASTTGVLFAPPGGCTAATGAGAGG